MASRTLFALISLVLISMGLIFALNIAPFVSSPGVKGYIQLNDIRGMSISYAGKEYTLNFEQQNEVALLLNLSLPFEAANSAELEPVPFEKILIYVFKGPSIEIMPLGFKNNALIYSATAWNPNGPLKDASDGRLKEILSHTYDR